MKLVKLITSSFVQGSRKMSLQVKVKYCQRDSCKKVWKNSTSFDEDACCDRKISHVDDEDCGCPNYKLFQVHGSYPGYRDPSLKFPLGTCPGVSAVCKRVLDTGLAPINKFSLEACCGGDCPCSCDSPKNCPNPALFPGGSWTWIGSVSHETKDWLTPVDANVRKIHTC